MKEVIESGKLKRFFDWRLSRAFAHPFREHLLAVFNERIASSREIGLEVGLEVPDFYKHVTVLEELGCIEEVQIERAARRLSRGKRERFFRAKATVELDDRGWQILPPSLRSDLRASLVQSVLDDLVRAMNGGTLGARGRADHMSWTPGRYDALGWGEACQIMHETFHRLIAIQRKSAERLADSGERGMPATIALLGFETPAAERLSS